MSQAINFIRAAVAASTLAIAACGGTGSAVSPSSLASAIGASSIKASAVISGSPNGTMIPGENEITDGSGNVWTLAGGVVSKNGALAGHSAGVTLLLYDNNKIYQQYTGGGWCWWNVSGWVCGGSDPRATASLSGDTIPAGSQITDSSANVWAVAGGVIYENGALAGYSKSVTLLVYDNKVIYQENSSGGWYAWTGSGWVSGSDPRATASPNGTDIPAVSQITDGSGNVWTVAGGVVYKNGALAAYSHGVTQLVYDNSVVYQQYSGSTWWSWTGSAWRASTAPSIATAPTISGSPTTSEFVGQAYSFVPTTTNPGGGTLSFSIENLPAWASFSKVTGALTGTPSSTQAGAYSNVVISASNGSASASLGAFSITVSMGSASLSWTPPTHNTNGTVLADLSGYTILYGTSSGALTQTVQLTDASATGYVVANLGAGTYYFAVVADATDGTQSAESAIGTKTIL